MAQSSDMREPAGHDGKRLENVKVLHLRTMCINPYNILIPPFLDPTTVTLLIFNYRGATKTPVPFLQLASLSNLEVLSIITVSHIKFTVQDFPSFPNLKYMDIQGATISAEFIPFLLSSSEDHPHLPSLECLVMHDHGTYPTPELKLHYRRRFSSPPLKRRQRCISI
ncbi:hypothetical protein M422DRAFT_252997 [Sphaerobolus stellatus SS14]|uniref:Uncharacterized protein n=1 Tax=Sphaerobolus stellatus (strain SS14) TaxID=990650 RepID=A0A0C9VXT5_SPHS4|nr:hypothetical protein M422DRAFT_252997 [Sphaerobolus stellatus SS14]